MNEDIMKNHRKDVLEDRAYRAAIFFKNITRNSLKETIRGSKILHISKKRNIEIPKRLYENEAQKKNIKLLPCNLNTRISTHISQSAYNNKYILSLSQRDTRTDVKRLLSLSIKWRK